MRDTVKISKFDYRITAHLNPSKFAYKVIRKSDAVETPLKFDSLILMNASKYVRSLNCDSVDVP